MMVIKWVSQEVRTSDMPLKITQSGSSIYQLFEVFLLEHKATWTQDTKDLHKTERAQLSRCKLAEQWDSLQDLGRYSDLEGSWPVPAEIETCWQGRSLHPGISLCGRHSTGMPRAKVQTATCLVSVFEIILLLLPLFILCHIWSQMLAAASPP